MTFKNIYEGKKVLITGHTGFKGSWLTCWLLNLGAKVSGISNEIPTSPSMFQVLGLENKIDHFLCDIRDLIKCEEIIRDIRPDFVFHLAAQAIVSAAYLNPLDTISTNVVGTANMLDLIKRIEWKCACIIITSDKCYENVEWEWGYKETDRLGGKDIYSASKGAAEVIFHAYFESFIKNNQDVTIASGRAGNVIGGGDWAKDRIIVDAIKSWNNNLPVQIRSPLATRPWQHVLEPLSGYLTLGMYIYESRELNGSSFNFGPRSEQNRTVLDLITKMSKIWGHKDQGDAFKVVDNLVFHEAGLLKLNCDKALFHLSWEANLSYDQCVRFVSEWYAKYYKDKNVDLLDFTFSQIREYQSIGQSKGFVWTH